MRGWEGPLPLQLAPLLGAPLAPPRPAKSVMTKLLVSQN